MNADETGTSAGAGQWICRYCGGSHQGVICPRVKAIEYYPDGGKKRLEFLTPADYLQPMPANLNTPGLPVQLPGTPWPPAGWPLPAGPTCASPGGVIKTEAAP